MLSEFEQLVGSKRFAPASNQCIDALQCAMGRALPHHHRKVLEISNGLSGYHGYVRMFGAGSSSPFDSIKWNDVETWKFAWNSEQVGYWCFGETVWGDQYAYRAAGLDPLDQQVYFLEATTMAAEIIAPDFEHFYETEFVRNSRAPYDSVTIQAFKRMGPVDLKEHLIYIPPLAISGDENIEHVAKMDARVSMIINGDVHSQLSQLPSDAVIRGVSYYDDNRGRTRLKLMVN